MRSSVIVIAAALTIAVPTLSADDRIASPTTPALFTRDVVPILSRKNCNTSNCHAALGGKGNIQLSPLGSDAAADYRALTRADMGRRISTVVPEKSLLLTRLTNPRSATKLGRDSTSYRILHRWIAAGAPGPRPTDPVLVRLNVAPRELVLSSGQSRQVRVAATWSDGVHRDVTEWAVYRSRAAHIATVTEAGQVTAVKPERTLIRIRFAGRTAAVPVSVQSDTAESDWNWTGDGIIDKLAAARWHHVHQEPVGDAQPIVWLRRLHLQLTGTVPDAWEAQEFAHSPTPAKQLQAIDRLLANPEYAEHWSRIWVDWLLEDDRIGSSGPDIVFKQLKQVGGRNRLHNWVRRALLENKSLDQLARDIVTATGTTAENGSVVFYVAHATTDDRVRAFGRVFLGADLRCARCHNHPHAGFNSHDFYSLAACFQQLQLQAAQGTARIALRTTRSKFTNPRTGLPLHPAAFGQRLTVDGASDQRAVLADWLLSKGRRQFARNLVNRYWSQVFGRGLVEPLDQLSSANPATHPELLETLTQEFIEHGYDAQHLLRRLCSARINRLGSDPLVRGDAKHYDHIYHSRFIPRRIRTDVLMRLIGTIARVDVPDSKHPFSSALKPRNEDDVKCSRDAWSASGWSSLHLIGNSLADILREPRGLVQQLTDSPASTDEIGQRLFLEVLSRRPTQKEISQVGEHFAKTPRRQAIEDVVWALFNTKEFLFMH